VRERERERDEYTHMGCIYIFTHIYMYIHTQSLIQLSTFDIEVCIMSTARPILFTIIIKEKGEGES